VTAAGRAATATRTAPAGRSPLAHEHRLTELDSGVRIVTEAMPSVRSVSLGYWIGTGSRAETDEQAGLSHLLEHLLFKGTARFESQEIDEIFDAMGAEINAGTGKETTSVYSRVIDDHLERAFDVMSDMVWAPRLDDVDSEREVILEEIAMYEDDPQDKIFDVLGEAVFGSHPLGRAIIGRAQVVAETPVPEIRAFHAGRYVPKNIVIAAAGAVDHDALVEMARARIPESDPTRPLAIASEPALELVPRLRFERKDTEQYHVSLGAPGLARDDQRRFALRVLDTIFGGTSSSRLFQEVREKRGLAYSIYSFSGQYADTGQVGVYVGTRAENLSAALEVVAVELERLRREGPSVAELERAKDNLRGRMVLALESTGARMNRLGSSLLTNVPLLTVDEAVAAVEAVTLEDVTALAGELYDPARISGAGIGPEESAFRTAVAPVGGVLA